jgi:alkaline phosphatase D
MLRGMDGTTRDILRLARRGLLRGGLAAAALRAVATPARAQAAGNPFTLGVAAGDPWPDGFVIWTRLATAPLEPGGGMGAEPVEVTWEVAADPRFASLAQRGSVIARAESAHAVHVVLAGLAPGRPWFYRFRARGSVSAAGQARTAPAPGAMPARLGLAVAGCQHYEHGFFTAWRHIAEEPDLDLVFHYGDSIYEYAGRPVGSRGWGGVVRSHLGGETVTLEQYRQRHAQYRLDPDLQAAQAAHAFAISFDDHEVENNWAGPIGQRFPRLPPHPPELLRDFALRKAAAFQAWYEHMPVRAAMRPDGPAITGYRRLRHGRLATLHVLDTRSFRDDQPCGDRGGLPCEEVARPDAQMLGAAQEAWLLDGLAGAEGWQILAQQVPVMPHVSAAGGISMDKWDAYPAARARLIRGLVERRVADPVILSGDVHQARVGTLHREPGDAASPAVASEFVATSITSEGDGAEAPSRAAEYRAANPHLAFLHGRRGYTRLDLAEGRLEARCVSLAQVSRAGAPAATAGRFVVERGRPGPRAM